MNPANIKKTLVLIPSFALLILLIQQNYNSIFGMMIGTAVALSSCELIQKAVNNVFVRKGSRSTRFFFVGFFFRFILLAALLYLAIVYFKVDVIALAISFTFVQLIYPFYLLHSLESRQKNV